jgi:hypothetical protein
MDNIRLNDVEAIRIMRAGGNLRVRGAGAGDTIFQSDAEPQIRRVENRAEVLLAGNATIEVAEGVALELLECVGNLDIEDIATPLSLGRVRGNLRARRVGAVAIRGEVAGNLSLEDAHAVEGEQVNGNLRMEGARSIKFREVRGNADCGTIEGEVSVDEVRGRLRVTVAGPVTARHVGGKLQAQGIASLKVDEVAGKAKATEVAGDVILGKVGGRLGCDDIAGNVSADEVADHVGLREVRGAVNLPRVGGAVDLMGPLPKSGTWLIISRGRINVEIAPDDSLCCNLTAEHGRVRFYGVPENGFRRMGNELKGEIGEGGLKINLTTTDADIILFADGDAHARDYDGRRRSSEFRFGHRFAAPFENFAEDLREEVPEFVGEILGAAGRIVSESGKFTGAVAHDVTRSVGDALREVERALSDLDDKVPHEVRDKFSRLGRKISDAVERAVEEARARRRDRSRSREEGAPASASSSAAPSEEGDPVPGSEGTRDAAIMKILNAVREGTLNPDEADRLIAAWAELHRASGDTHTE